MELLKTKSKLSARAIAALCAVLGAVALPQVLHAAGSLSGTGAALGTALLPMHLAVFAVGLLAGAAAGALVGAVSPFVSFALSGMPTADLLPFMALELAVYGLVCGLLKNKNLPIAVKVLIAQVVGRFVKAGALAVAFYGFGHTAVAPISVLTTAVTGIFGILLQLVLLPLLLRGLKQYEKYYA